MIENGGNTIFISFHTCVSYDADFEGAGRGAVARQDMRIGDIAMEIPLSIVISENLVHASQMVHVVNVIAFAWLNYLCFLLAFSLGLLQ